MFKIDDAVRIYGTNSILDEKIGRILSNVFNIGIMRCYFIDTCHIHVNYGFENKATIIPEGMLCLAYNEEQEDQANNEGLVNG